MNTFPGIHLTREQMEQRRLMAADDLAAGMKKIDVARKYNVNPSSVSRWAKKLRENGKTSLARRKAKGARSKLDLKQKNRLIDILVLGAYAYGFETDLWTAKRVCVVIDKEFGVKYHFKHVPKLLRSLDFRLVKPERKATEKDEDKKTAWLKTTWVHIKKT